MSFKNPKNLIVVVSVLAALMAGTVLLGGYANSKPADSEAPVKACQGKMTGCPIMAASDQAASCCAEKQANGTCEMPCPTDCPKPCCADKPCPVDCPKPCCAGTPAEGCCGTAEKAGCCAAGAEETAAQ